MASVFDRGKVMDVSIEGLVEAQRKIQLAQDAVDPRDGLKAVMRIATGQLHRYIIGQPPAIMRVDTGRLKNSIFPDVRTVRGEALGTVATNVEYAPHVEDRYGFFARGIENQQQSINSLFSDHARGITR